VAHSASPNSLQWPIAHNQIRRGGPSRRRTQKVEYLGEFESVFEIALNHESEGQLGFFLGTIGEITLDKKSHATVLLGI
jgi:hypothetical protein